MCQIGTSRKATAVFNIPNWNLKEFERKAE